MTVTSTGIILTDLKRFLQNLRGHSTAVFIGLLVLLVSCKLMTYKVSASAS